MIAVEVFISGGADTDECRDVSLAVIRHLQQMFQKTMGVPISIGNWDYRIDPPAVVPGGAVATRSLQMVERSNALVAVFGAAVPEITCQEIRQGFQLRSEGNSVEVWTFLNPDAKTEDHETFLRNINEEFGVQIVYTPYRNLLEFQAMLFTTMIPYLLRRIEDAGVPLLGGYR